MQKQHKKSKESTDVNICFPNMLERYNKLGDCENS